MQERIDYKKFNFQLARKVLEGKNIVFTGRGFLVRGELMRLARQAGANVDSVVTKKCDILIVGEKPGSKLRKANVLGCEIITISDFKDILEGKVRKNEMEIIIRLLSFGPVVEAVAPIDFRMKVKLRVDKQFSLTNK